MRVTERTHMAHCVRPNVPKILYDQYWSVGCCLESQGKRLVKVKVQHMRLHACSSSGLALQLAGTTIAF